ncbi:uncharacterized protein EI90DRAFT_3128510 [Cantharellus anzutake]|uniref:uncharacterized protein n=1 Tax=Cantharellus anzutake TaxID=1750568 RepID=UPI0019080DA8|nr:uncharacterized protein EI90DRAFT_3128510 [Cantharellus anzutake]KAF8325638.1 hypothetical protein EI90DRAFT_3128510 [Cantharellus anzutake]
MSFLSVPSSNNITTPTSSPHQHTEHSPAVISETSEFPARRDSTTSRSQLTSSSTCSLPIPSPTVNGNTTPVTPMVTSGVTSGPSDTAESSFSHSAPTPIIEIRRTSPSVCREVGDLIETPFLRDLRFDDHDFGNLNSCLNGTENGGATIGSRTGSSSSTVPLSKQRPRSFHSTLSTSSSASSSSDSHANSSEFSACSGASFGATTPPIMSTPSNNLGSSTTTTTTTTFTRTTSGPSSRTSDNPKAGLGFGGKGFGRQKAAHPFSYSTPARVSISSSSRSTHSHSTSSSTSTVTPASTPNTSLTLTTSPNVSTSSRSHPNVNDNQKRSSLVISSSEKRSFSVPTPTYSPKNPTTLPPPSLRNRSRNNPRKDNRRRSRREPVVPKEYVSFLDLGVPMDFDQRTMRPKSGSSTSSSDSDPGEKGEWISASSSASSQDDGIACRTPPSQVESFAIETAFNDGDAELMIRRGSESDALDDATFFRNEVEKMLKRYEDVRASWALTKRVNLSPDLGGAGDETQDTVQEYQREEMEEYKVMAIQDDATPRQGAVAIPPSSSPLSLPSATLRPPRRAAPPPPISVHTSPSSPTSENSPHSNSTSSSPSLSPLPSPQGLIPSHSQSPTTPTTRPSFSLFPPPFPSSTSTPTSTSPSTPRTPVLKTPLSSYSGFSTVATLTSPSKRASLALAVALAEEEDVKRSVRESVYEPVDIVNVFAEGSEDDDVDAFEGVEIRLVGAHQSDGLGIAIGAITQDGALSPYSSLPFEGSPTSPEDVQDEDADTDSILEKDKQSLLSESTSGSDEGEEAYVTLISSILSPPSSPPTMMKVVRSDSVVSDMTFTLETLS